MAPECFKRRMSSFSLELVLKPIKTNVTHIYRIQLTGFNFKTGVVFFKG